MMIHMKYQGIFSSWNTMRMFEITSERQCVVRNLINFLHRPTMQDAHIFRINTV